MAGALDCLSAGDEQAGRATTFRSESDRWKIELRIMGDYYAALVDPSATKADASERAQVIRDALAAEGIIRLETSTECVFNGEGYLPGPRLNDLYTFDQDNGSRPDELGYWDSLAVCGVQFHVERWVNFFGVPQFEFAQCPGCGRTFDDNSEFANSQFMSSLMEAIAEFIQSDPPTILVCPVCDTSHEVQRWITTPHLGFCQMAIQFWNWPDFSSRGWHISIPQIASNAVGYPLIATYGRL